MSDAFTLITRVHYTWDETTWIDGFSVAENENVRDAFHNCMEVYLRGQFPAAEIIVERKNIQKCKVWFFSDAGEWMDDKSLESEDVREYAREIWDILVKKYYIKRPR